MDIESCNFILINTTSMKIAFGTATRAPDDMILVQEYYRKDNNAYFPYEESNDPPDEITHFGKTFTLLRASIEDGTGIYQYIDSTLKR